MSPAGRSQPEQKSRTIGLFKSACQHTKWVQERWRVNVAGSADNNPVYLVFHKMKFLVKLSFDLFSIHLTCLGISVFVEQMFAI